MKEMLKQNVLIVICALCTCVLLSSCRHAVPEEKRVDVISSIAVIVNDNYTSHDGENPLMISMTEIEELAVDNSDLKESIEKYDDVKQYKVYLLDDNMVLVVTDSLFQGIKGYVVSNEELEGTLKVSGLGFDADRVTILNRIEDSNIYSFSAGQ